MFSIHFNTLQYSWKAKWIFPTELKSAQAGNEILHAYCGTEGNLPDDSALVTEIFLFFHISIIREHAGWSEEKRNGRKGSVES